MERSNPAFSFDHPLEAHAVDVPLLRSSPVSLCMSQSPATLEYPEAKIVRSLITSNVKSRITAANAS